MIYCLDWILYKWKAEQMQFSWIFKCKYKDYTALFSKSFGSLCSVLDPCSHKLNLKMGYFPCSEGSFVGMGCHTLSCFTCVYPPCHRPSMVGGLPMEGTNFLLQKPNTLLLVSHSTRARSCRLNVQQDISNHTQTQWELSLCTACDVGASPWALM